MTNIVYLVGTMYSQKQSSWGFIGIFSTKQKAENACVDSRDFVARLTIDEIPEECECDSRCTDCGDSVIAFPDREILSKVDALRNKARDN